MAPTWIDVSSHCRIEVLADDSGDFLGLGSVLLDGRPARSGRRPIVVRLDTATGVLYPRLTIRSIERAADGFDVTLTAHGVRWGRSEFGDDYDQSAYVLSDSDGPIQDSLTIELRPASVTIHSRVFHGFSHRLRIESAERRFHRALLHATWELGGSITGNTVLSQGQCNMPVYRGQRETLFTTACLKTLDQYGKPAGNSFQLGPRGGLIQGFDFQYDGNGALLQYWPESSSVSSLLESPPGSDLLHVVDECRFTEATHAHTPAKHVVHLAAALTEHEARDLWWEARAFVYGRNRAEFGIRETTPRPEIAFKYATRVDSGRLKMEVGGEEVDSTEVPYAIAERVLPALAQQGVTRFFPEVMSESDVTALGMKRKLDQGVHGDLHCASVCATHRFFPSEFWGGIKAWRAMADKARSLGIEIGAWFAPHFSPRSPIFEKHPEYRMMSVTGLPAGGGYGFQTLVVADWNTGVFQLVLDDLRRWRDEGGLDYLFVDSLSNMGLVQANYAAAMRTNWKALGRLMGEIQKLGIGSISCECISPWLAGRFGVADLRGDLLDQDRAVAGQNDFGWWANELDMAAGLSLFVGARKRSPEELERFLFRAIASGGYICYEHQYTRDHALADWWSRLNRVLNQARPHMGTRRLLPGGAGVAWHSRGGDASVYFAFEPIQLNVKAIAGVERLDGGSTTALTHQGTVRLAPGCVYLVR